MANKYVRRALLTDAEMERTVSWLDRADSTEV